MALVYLGGVAGLVAFALAVYAGGTLRRTGLLLAVGACLTVAWLLVIYFSAPSTDRPSGCSDCGMHLGKWLDTAAIFVVVGANAVAWLLGVLIGSLVRAAAGPRAFSRRGEVRRAR